MAGITFNFRSGYLTNKHKSRKCKLNSYLKKGDWYSQNVVMCQVQGKPVRPLPS